METIQLNISNFPIELRDSLRKIAEENRRSTQAQIIFILEEYVRTSN